MTPHELDAARKLFFDYDGSRFYMSRDGVEDRYFQSKIDAATESEWLRQLTLKKLEGLASPGNWWTILFLEQHSNFSHLDKLISVEPLGVLWERCAYCEHLLTYAIRCSGTADRNLIRLAITRVVELSRKLLTRSRSTDSKRRVQQLIDKAEANLADT